MITFKSYLNEARMAPLYHATYGDRVVDIINDRGIMPNTHHNVKTLMMKKSKNKARIEAGEDYSMISGVSLTRNLRFAKKWREASGWIIEFDQQKLASRYKIIPIQFWQEFAWDKLLNKSSDKHSQFSKSRAEGDKHEFNEFEEFVISKNIIPLHFIKKIYYPYDNRYSTQNIVDQVKAAMKNVNSNIELVPHGKRWDAKDYFDR